MTQGVEKAVEELRDMGVSPGDPVPVPGGKVAVVFIDYTIPEGMHQGEKIRLGIGVPVAYNDIGPHFVHLPENIVMPREGHQSSSIQGHRKWSRPCKEHWQDNSAQRSMRWYVNRHLLRLWEEKWYAA